MFLSNKVTHCLKNATALCSVRLIQKKIWDLHFHEEYQQEESGATVACIFCIESSKSGLDPLVFQNFDFRIRLSPEQRAIFRRYSETIICFGDFHFPICVIRHDNLQSQLFPHSTHLTGVLFDSSNTRIDKKNTRSLYHLARFYALPFYFPAIPFSCLPTITCLHQVVDVFGNSKMHLVK